MTDSKPLMRMYFSGELEPGRACTLPQRQAHHAVRVLRLETSAVVTLFNGDGAEYQAVVERIEKDGVRVKVQQRVQAGRESPLEIVLGQGLSSGERMDYTVQKAVELGVAAIQPLAARRSVVRLHGERAERRVEHWQAIAIAACEQCGRNRVPQVLPLLQLDAYLAGRAAQASDERRVLLSPRSARRLRDLKPPVGAVVLLAGPEGGYSPDEERAAEQAGFQPVRLGPRVLRTETAAVAALAAMQALWGDF
jgi:16S rRNA (uracil1498-N3)-methyltransferase